MKAYRLDEEQISNIETIVETLRAKHQDGGPGSGNWGHLGRHGLRGGSMPGGGIQNRRYAKKGDPKSGFLSSAMERRAAARLHTLNTGELLHAKDGTVLTGLEGYPGTWVAEKDGSFTSYRDAANPDRKLTFRTIQELCERGTKGRISIPVAEALQLTPEERERWKNPKGPEGYEPAKTVEEMVGADALKEYDTGDHPNACPPDDPEWGTKPGIYTVYRAGSIDRDVVFTANRFDGASDYASAFPRGSGGVGTHSGDQAHACGVYTYTVEVRNPFVAKNLGAAYKELFGKKLRLDPNAREIKAGISSGDLWAKADSAVAKKLKALGYDAWVMTEPAPPAEREMNLLGAAKKSMKETARKVPDSIKESWEADVKLQGYNAYRFNGGKDTGISYEAWSNSDLYKVGRAQNRW